MCTCSPGVPTPRSSRGLPRPTFLAPMFPMSTPRIVSIFVITGASWVSAGVTYSDQASLGAKRYLESGGRGDSEGRIGICILPDA